MSNPAANPLLSIQFPVPFDRIAAEHVEPAIERLLADARADMQAIIDAPAPRTYNNSLGALESLTERLWYVMTVVGHLESVVTSPALRAAYNAVQGPVSEFASSITLSSGLYAALKAFAATDEAAALSPTRRRLLTKTLDDFRRQGAELDEPGKQRLAAIDLELTERTTQFSQNLVDSTDAFELVVAEEPRLAGLPDSARDAARQSAAAKGHERGWRFTLHGPSFIAVMTYLDDRALREQVWRAYNTRATEAERDNRPLIAAILELRREKAALLGFDNFADLVLADRMAKTGAAARAFIDGLRARVEPYFEGENAALRAFARDHELLASDDALAPWDIAYLAEKQRRALYDYDEEALRPYFAVESVLEGMFEVVGRLYGVRVREAEGVPTWHPDVRSFAIDDEAGVELGLFYADLHPREGKRGGAWMNGLITGVVGPHGERDEGSRHLGLICANATPATDARPALLTHDEVLTLFHEFGHLMHHMLSRVEVRSLAGTNVAWDFVELPSQIMENWCWERDALDLFARHHKTGAPIPAELFSRMQRARNHRAAYRATRQLGFASVDLALHVTYDPTRDGDVIEHARALSRPFSAAPLPADYAMIAGFGHLFASPVGYAAGYYSYKWAEVLDADAFTRFKRAGVFSREVGEAFRRAILERGDSEDPEVLFRDFMGREPDPEALLERDGLAAGAA
ncbi:MAG: M3 family metallopeptidase [Myxococcales bacterium]|nr:M3 family metallopeptidase [Myxococcales bacterium]MCB9754810.1 M3 family metallopeptidase [Myxococcales bacterium]